MAKKIDVQKEPVKLREKVLKNGSIRRLRKSPLGS